MREHKKITTTAIAKVMPNRCRLCPLAAALAAVVSTNVDAQRDGPGQELALEEVVVTATRREATAQETGISINVLSGDALEKNNYTSIGQVLDGVPGVTGISSGPNNNRIIIRNVATSTQEAGSATTATYFDDFAISAARASAPEIRLVDMSRVEVLKGPQGTLFGRSAMGGIVRYISNKPTADKVSAGVKVYFSNTEDGGSNAGGHGFANLPLGDTLALRLVGYSYQNDGFIDNVELGQEDTNDEGTVGGRAALRWVPTEALTADLSYIYQEVEGALGRVTTIHTPSGDLAFNADRRDMVSGIEDQQTDKHDILNLNIEYAFDRFTAALIATSSEEKFKRVTDQREFIGLTQGCACDFLDDGNNSVVDTDILEVRLVSRGDWAVDWIAGAYREEADTRTQQLVRYFGQPALALGFIPLTDGSVQIDAQHALGHEESAVYGELGFHLSAAANLTLGYRRSDVEFSDSWLQASGLFDMVNGATALVGQTFETQEDVNTYKVLLEYSFTDGLFGYASATSGYRRGGFNFPTLTSPFSTFDSDTLWNYEIGLKSSLLGGRLTANVAAYYLDWDDMQLVVQDSVTFARATANVGKAAIPGLEFSLVYQVSDNFDVSFSGSLSSPELKQDVPGGLSGKKGDSLPGSAKENFALAANWRKPLPAGMELFASASYKYVGERLNDFNTDLDVRLPSYDLLDMRAGLVIGDSYSISLFAHNLLDESVVYLIDRQGPGFESVPTNRPRTLGLDLSWNF
ncbi:TonB-dependent receptor [Microbulbifer sp.]|uniref:TonB-dependent receptor n=1 Tax=Microbulbifer sp. TaxID=1908541 RepID=UPI003F3361F4